MRALVFLSRALAQLFSLPSSLGAESTILAYPPLRFAAPSSEVQEALRNFEHVFVYRDYEKLPEFQPGWAERIVDLGAYIGLYAIRFLKAAKRARALCVEANPLACVYLHWNLRLNGVGDRAWVECKAVDSWSGVDTLYVGESMVNSSILPSYVWEYSRVSHSVRVPKLTLEELLHRSGFKSVDLMKVDIEGLEERVLLSSLDVLSSYNVYRLVVELHEGFSSAKRISEALEGEYKVLVVVDESAPNQKFLYALRRR